MSKLSLPVSTSCVWIKERIAYLVNVPLDFGHEEVFGLAWKYASLPENEKLRLGKQSFQRSNNNTYRGFSPAQPGSDNLKEGFEISPPELPEAPKWAKARIDLPEANVWQAELSAPGLLGRSGKLHAELQILSSKFLSLIAVALGKEPAYFDPYLPNSVSTLRYLRYPAIKAPVSATRDSTCGLEVLGPDDEWVAAPYVPGSVVVNIGDLMAKVSGGRIRATFHRVRSSPGKERYSVPFFFEPGIDCTNQSVNGDGEKIVYGEHGLDKMKIWVEFQGLEKHAAIVDQIEIVEPEMA